MNRPPPSRPPGPRITHRVAVAQIRIVQTVESVRSIRSIPCPFHSIPFHSLIARRALLPPSGLDRCASGAPSHRPLRREMDARHPSSADLACGPVDRWCSRWRAAVADLRRPTRRARGSAALAYRRRGPRLPRAGRRAEQTRAVARDGRARRGATAFRGELAAPAPGNVPTGEWISRSPANTGRWTKPSSRSRDVAEQRPGPTSANCLAVEMLPVAQLVDLPRRPAGPPGQSHGYRAAMRRTPSRIWASQVNFVQLRVVLVVGGVLRHLIRKKLASAVIVVADGFVRFARAQLGQVGAPIGDTSRLERRSLGGGVRSATGDRRGVEQAGSGAPRRWCSSSCPPVRLGKSQDNPSSSIC